MMEPQERRIDQRNHSYAKAFLPDHNAIGYIRDISTGGFRIEALGDPGIPEKVEVTAVFIPNEEMRFPPFTLRGRVEWRHENPPTTSLGIAVTRYVSPGSARLFRRFRKIWKRLAT
jgi:hypothetical protein